MLRRLALTAVALPVLAVGCPAQDSDKGRALAAKLCAVCHMQSGQLEKHGKAGVPAFTAVANRPHQTHEAIVGWLRSNPSRMPEHRLTWDEVDALAAFIMTLRKPD
ncbi:MAG: c-type cytochrome [Hyphomicrobiaceae bacterium]